MNSIDLIKTRRSVRKYTDKKVDRKTMEDIIDIARWAPSWANTQTARYTIVDNEEVIKNIAENGMSDFAYNTKTLARAKGVAILSYVKGDSGTFKSKGGDDSYVTTKGNSWEVFDNGIACQTFCLAAHAKGVGTVIFGVFDDKKISDIINLSDEEEVGAVIVYGYPAHETKPTPRKEVKEILRFFEK